MIASIMSENAISVKYTKTRYIPSYGPERNGVTMAFFNVRHGRNRAYNPEGLERTPFHLCGH